MGFLDNILKSNKTGSKKREIMPVLPKEIYEAATLELQDILAPSALKVSPKNLNLGDKITRTYFVISYPRYLSDNWFTPIINLDKIFDVAIHIHNINTEDILKKFQKKVAEVQSQINVRESKGLVRDPVLDTAYQDLENLRDSLQQAQQKMFDVGLYITIYADNEKELSKIESEIKSMLESKLVYIKPALFQQDVGFNSVIPTGNDFLAIHQKLNSEPLSSLFPFVSFDLSSDKGILYGVNRHNSSLIIFDRFSLENYNSVTFAKSGSGKSYSTKLEILRTLMFDAEVIVIDPEREYEYLAEAIGGRYFNISLSSEHHINPFDLPMPTGDETPDDVLRGNTIQLVGLFRIMLGGLTAEEDALVDKAITETYAMKDISAESDFSNIEPPLLSDFEMVLSGLEGSESVVTRLLKFTQGTWKNFLNQPTNVDINRKFIVFSVRDMEDDLKPVAMYIITHFIWNAVRKNLKKRLLIVDEAWWMMKSEDTASFLYSIAKRGRKYYLGLSTITQDVNDFINSPYGMPIVTNSSMQILLKQSTSSADALQKVFNLTDEEKYLLLESEVGEGIFFAGLKHVAIKIIASYTEDQIITSDPSQILAIKKAKEEYMEEEGRNNNSSNERDDSYKVNYKEPEVEYIPEEPASLEEVEPETPPEEVKAEESTERPVKIRVVSSDSSEIGKIEEENNKLDAEIKELEKMFGDQI
jgi:conjugal transfer ATP-binding protein TraC